MAGERQAHMPSSTWATAVWVAAFAPATTVLFAGFFLAAAATTLFLFVVLFATFIAPMAGIRCAWHGEKRQGQEEGERYVQYLLHFEALSTITDDGGNSSRGVGWEAWTHSDFNNNPRQIHFISKK